MRTNKQDQDERRGHYYKLTTVKKQKKTDKASRWILLAYPAQKNIIFFRGKAALITNTCH
jgi:hypothetical protein